MSRNKPKKPAKSEPVQNPPIQGKPVNPIPQGQIQEFIAAYSESFEGPLPHPDILRRYDELVPGSAKQIIDIFAEQATHRMSLEKTVINGDSWRAY